MRPENATGRLGPAAMVIELAGAPGAGKTTVLPLVVDAVRKRGLDVLDPQRAGRALAARTRPWEAFGRWVADRHRDRALWFIYVMYSTAFGVGLMLSRPGLARLLARQSRRPPEAMVSERHVVRWFIRHAGTERMFRRFGKMGEVLIVDEGYVHRVVQLFTSAVEQADTNAVRGYLLEVPTPELLVFVDAPADIAFSRIQARGVWMRMSELDDEDVATFVRNASEAVSHAAACVRNEGWRVVAVANDADIDSLAFELPANFANRAGSDE